MTKRVVIRCDFCAAEAVHTTVPIAFGQAEPHILNLCTLHFEELLDPVMEMTSS